MNKTPLKIEIFSSSLYKLIQGNGSYNRPYYMNSIVTPDCYGFVIAANGRIGRFIKFKLCILSKESLSKSAIIKITPVMKSSMFMRNRISSFNN